MISLVAAQGFPARRVIALLDVSESGYYAWRERTPSARSLRRAWLARMILDIHRESGSTFGYRRVRKELEHRYGISVSHGTVELLMNQAGIRGRAGHLRDQALQRAARPQSHRWIVDVLAFSTLQGSLYTAVVLDITSRRLIGWSTAATAETALVHRALVAAITRGAGTDPPAETAQHDPLACFFTERAVTLECAPVSGAMGDWYDHAVVEAFWEEIHREPAGPDSWQDAEVLEAELIETFEHFTRQERAAGRRAHPHRGRINADDTSGPPSAPVRRPGGRMRAPRRR
ncbi:hypothetical protein C1I97_25295 [Streptomyces sp. NTH33]|uniref:IS3 family transposase n=1 Tax=Streptomyces sp. NTH33 TaxID=1735453 RepID=UPI000DA92795|nr:IS3 family transposase [Streptomyces sp. NTH33]PZG97496.1 hypothetical protein C1I97_25295 [Streptomyces sp. NTH33]